MASSSNKRYELGQQIGSGDFAAVYAATDRKLSRDVAIKKIHAQYLADEEKLARYWQEAQLLGSLEHPNIMTIYDVLKSKGSLVLELMQGSIKQIYAGRAMPVDDVRQMLLQASNGLHNLHSNGIIHGDIKPGNLLLSRQNLVKLGDFGLARRASDSDGSLLKGAAKYMAPELVSDQFGPVRPASDLYSLGFSALELMCGPDYDSLFPELSAFGRDQQMAWMMWHCSADRKLPPIGTMLEGVPEDLAAVIQKLTTKDQEQRYQSAAQVINDLNTGGVQVPVGESLKQEAAAEEEALKQKKRKRLMAIGMFAASLLMCAGIMFFPGKKEEVVAEAPVEKPIEGIVQTVFPVHDKLVIDLAEPTDADEIASDNRKGYTELTLYPEDRIFLNRKERLLRDLQEGDRIVVTKAKDANDVAYRELSAFRPETRGGLIKHLDPDQGKFVLLIDNSTSDEEVTLNVPLKIPMTINGQEEFKGRSVELSQLSVGDRANVEFVEEQTGFEALSLDALRVVSSAGVVRDVNLSKNAMTIVSETDGGKLLTFPFAPKCQVTLNDMRFVQDQLLKPKDLKPGDKVTIQYDVKIVGVDAKRLYNEAGTISQIDYATRTVSVRKESDATTVYVVPENAPLSLGGETISITDLRRNDIVKIEHDAPGDKTPEILALSAIRPPNSMKWALFIANQNFDDATLPQLAYPIGDATNLRDQMIKRYAVPQDQAILFTDESRVRLEQAVPAFLNKVPADAELYVYLTGHAFADAAPDSRDLTGVFIAPKDFALSRVADTGINLDWLVGLVEASQPARKILLLDCCHSAAESASAPQPSTDKMVEIIRRKHEGGYPETTFVLTSCSDDQRGKPSADKPDSGVFGSTLAAAFAGAADQARDNNIDFTELSKYVIPQVSSASSTSQTPKLFLPDDTPPRLTEAAKDSIRQMLTQFSRRKLDANRMRSQAEAANDLANGEPEAMLAGSLLVLKAGDRSQAMEMLEQVRLAHPDDPLTYELLAWIHFDLRDFASGQNMLQLLAKKIPSTDEYNDRELALIEWIGRLRELGGRADWSRRKPEPAISNAIDSAIAARGDKATKVYEAGRKKVIAMFEAFDKQIAEDPSEENSINLKRRRLSIYAKLNPEPAIASIKASLENASN